MEQGEGGHVVEIIVDPGLSVLPCYRHITQGLRESRTMIVNGSRTSAVGILVSVHPWGFDGILVFGMHDLGQRVVDDIAVDVGVEM